MKISEQEQLKNSTEYVAETIFEYQRGSCWGTFGGSNIDSTGCSTFFYCQWCGQRYENFEPRQPCPKFPFPEFSILDLMRKLGSMGIAITLRYDPLRDKNNFTLIGPKGRICDTETPLESLCNWLLEPNNCKKFGMIGITPEAIVAFAEQIE